MFNSPYEILLSPLLIAQGLYTKFKTPRLAEAQGQREGSIGQGENLRLILCGDSAAAGVGANLQQEALSGQVLHLLQEYYQCQWCLEAKSGYTSAAFITHLEQLTAQNFDIAIVSIGVNDVTKIVSIETWNKNIAKIHTLLTQKFAVKYVIYSAIPAMQQFPALPFPLRYFLGKTAQQMNRQLQEKYNNKKDSTVLSIQLPITTHYMAHDGFHPNPVGYTLWAQHVVQLVLQYQNKIPPKIDF